MKKTKIVSLILSAVMLLSLIPAMSLTGFAENPTDMPTHLPDLRVEDEADVKQGVYKVYWGVHNNADGSINTSLGRLPFGDAGQLPEYTQGQAIIATEFFSGDAVAKQSVETQFWLDETVAVPENAVGIIIKATATGANGNSGIRFNPDLYKSADGDNAIKDYECVTDSKTGTYAYYYDATNGVWRAAGAEHSYRVSDTFNGYVYIPFDSYLTYGYGRGEAMSAPLVKDMYIKGFRIGYWWSAASFSVQNAYFVSISDIPSTVDDVWDGTADTSWFDENNIQDSYELDSAEKVAGLAKLMVEKATDKEAENFPYNVANKMVTFYITKNLDLAGLDWTPIGNTYNRRFGGNIVGKLGGVEGAAVTIKNLKLTGSNQDNIGFIGTIDGEAKAAGAQVKNLYFVDPVIDSNVNTAMGIVCGYARSGGVFSNIRVSGASITSAEGSADATWIGGICAYSKHGTNADAIVFENCSFDGSITVKGAAGSVGGIIGEATVGAALKNCYVGGEILPGASCTNVGGLIGFVNNSANAAKLNNCQMSADIRTASAANENGALVGSANNITAENCFVSGVAVKTNGTTAKLMALIGADRGSATLTNCYSLTKNPIAANKEGTGVATVLSGADLFGDAAKTALAGFDFETVWATREGVYPVLAIVAETASAANANIDLSWYDDAAKELTISTFPALVGFAKMGQVDPFAGKTVKLGASIDGAAKQADQILRVGVKEEGGYTCCFLGVFDQADFEITNVDFKLVEEIDKFTVTWELGADSIVEVYVYGATPEFKGETVRPSDNRYSYEFVKWDPVIVPVTEDTVYSAVWKSIPLENEPDTDDNTEQTTPENESQTDAPEKETAGANGTTAETAVDKGGEEAGCASSVSPIFGMALILLAAIAVCGFKKSKEQ